jgi:hypothetical protein
VDRRIQRSGEGFSKILQKVAGRQLVLVRNDLSANDCYRVKLRHIGNHLQLDVIVGRDP